MKDKSRNNNKIMSAIGNNHHKESSKTTFWKKNAKNVPGSSKPVYGAQYPPRNEPGPPSAPTTPKKTAIGPRGNGAGGAGAAGAGVNDSFQEFASSTQDAWDDADDELITMANVKLSMQDVHDTALQVINQHSEEQRAKIATQQFQQAAASRQSIGGSPRAPGVGVRLNQQQKPSSLRMTSSPRYNNISNSATSDTNNERHRAKLEKFRTILAAPTLNIDELRKLTWSGIPPQYRPTAWKILSGYLPASEERREAVLARKREEYHNFVKQYFGDRLQEQKDTFRQIHIDIPRMSPLIPLFQQDVVQHLFERLLFIWAIRHPASGYVQGINDLVTPFFVVFLTEYISNDTSVDSVDVSTLKESDRDALEADCFWCFSKLLDGIQDNYTFAQPGIQTKVDGLKHLTSRIDKTLHDHLISQNVEYLQFAFRWMNNLLMREIPLRCVIRLWDTYLSEPEGFATFHLYVCGAFLTHFSQDLMRELDFQGLLILLQNLPTHHWGDEQVQLLLAEAFKLKFMFADAPNHLDSKNTKKSKP